MATSTATVLIPGTVVHQRYVIQEVRQYHDQYQRYLASDRHHLEQFHLLTTFPRHKLDPLRSAHLQEVFDQRTAPLLALNHPQFPRFTAAFGEADRFFLVQQPPRGVPYRQLLKLRQSLGQTLTEPEVLHLLSHLLPALQALHSRKLIHRKISPDSILLPVPLPRSPQALRAAVYHEMPLLVELGAVEAIAYQLFTLQSQKPPAELALSPIARLGYAPPEQVQTGRIYAHSDLYALAVTCLELLTGQPPQQLLDSHTLTWSWQAYTSLSQPFEAILSRMLAWQPGDRYNSAQAVLQALQTLGSEHSLLTPTQTGPGSPRPGEANAMLSFDHLTIDNFLKPRRQGRPGLRSPQPSQAQTRARKGGGRSRPQPSRRRMPWVVAVCSGAIASTFLLLSPQVHSPLSTNSPTSSPSSRPPWHWLTALPSHLWPNRHPRAQASPEAELPGSPPRDSAPGPKPQTSPAIPPSVLGGADSNIPIPIYLSATTPDQAVQGSLYVLNAQTYFVAGQPNQILSVTLEAEAAKLQVLNEAKQPIAGYLSESHSWEGPLSAVERTLLSVTGEGSYELKLQLKAAP